MDSPHKATKIGLNQWYSGTVHILKDHTRGDVAFFFFVIIFVALYTAAITSSAI